MNNQDKQVPGLLLPSSEAMGYINDLRSKYHRGQPEKYSGKERFLVEKFSGEMKQHLLPNDIRDYRIEKLGSALESLSPAAPLVKIPTYAVFPDSRLYVTSDILGHSHFLEYQYVLLSFETFGNFVKQLLPSEVRDLFAGYTPMYDAYIFDKDLKWCLCIDHNGYYTLVGEFSIFHDM